MSGRWWRAYTRARHDPKVQKLSGDLFKIWFNLVCFAGENEGKIPLSDIAFELRTTEAKARKAVGALIAAGLFVQSEQGLTPHNWDGLQYESDSAAERMRRYRQRHRDETVTSPVTSPLRSREESDTEQNRTESEVAPKRSPRTGSRLPDDWQPSKEDRFFAEQYDIDCDATSAVFRDYWHGIAGAKGLKADWPGTWRNWVRREVQSRQNRANGRAQFAKDVAAATVTDDDRQWQARMRGWRQSKWWLGNQWGPPPDEPGTLVPPHLLKDAA